MSRDNLERTWDKLGREDPLWAVLSHRDKKGGRWDLGEFLKTGETEIDSVLEYVAPLHPDLRRDRALDFGCGVGRLSQALARTFSRVDGVDIAESMIGKARELNRHGDRCRYHLNPATDLGLFEDGGFDFIYSNVVIQHMPTDLGRGYLREFARVLGPGGLLVVQVPGEERKYVGARPGIGTTLRRAWDRLLRIAYLTWKRTLRGRPVMDMYGMTRTEVEALLEEAGLEVLDVVENDAAGPDWTSFRYCARKPG